MKYETLSLCIICFLIGVAYCSYNRTMLRQKFGIAGACSFPYCTLACLVNASLSSC